MSQNQIIIICQKTINIITYAQNENFVKKLLISLLMLKRKTL